LRAAASVGDIISLIASGVPTHFWGSQIG